MHEAAYRARLGAGRGHGRRHQRARAHRQPPSGARHGALQHLSLQRRLRGDLHRRPSGTGNRCASCWAARICRAPGLRDHARAGQEHGGDRRHGRRLDDRAHEGRGAEAPERGARAVRAGENGARGGVRSPSRGARLLGRHRPSAPRQARACRSRRSACTPAASRRSAAPRRRSASTPRRCSRSCWACKADELRGCAPSASPSP